MRLGEQRQVLLDGLTKFSNCRFQIGSKQYPLEHSFFEEQGGVRFNLNFTMVRNAQVYVYEKSDAMSHANLVRNGSYTRVDKK